MLRARSIGGFVLDEFIVDDADAVTRDDSQDPALALALRNHGAITPSSLQGGGVEGAAQVPTRAPSNGVDNNAALRGRRDA
jgi:hypothetical protein